MGDDENVHGMKKFARPQSAFLRWLGHGFSPVLDILRDALQALAGCLRSGRNFFDGGKHVGIVHLLADFLEKRMNLGKNEKQLAANARMQEEFFVE